jgi:glyoxylase-like metal-dependent hydrolase (beta-lactamase superfamily II)
MAHKQEQEDAQTEVTEVAKGILRMQLPIQMPGLGHVNMYCLLDGEGAAVVDPGLPDESSWLAILDRLKQAGLQARHVHTVVITHSHPDHFGGAARFAAETGCKVIAHRDFRVFGRGEHPHLDVSVEHLEDDGLGGRGPKPLLVDREPDDMPPWMLDASERPRMPWGGDPPTPSATQRARFEQARASGIRFTPKLTHAVEHGSLIRLARREFRVWHTPGHTNDHVCLHDPDEGIFLAGDHVLPSITPHISGHGGVSDPLRAFYESLDSVAQIEGVVRCLPAHGHPFGDLPARAFAIKRHHDERLEKFKAIGKRLGAATVRDFAQELFQPRNWGMMAESETFAHLEHLRLRGQADCHAREDGWLVYETDGPSA